MSVLKRNRLDKIKEEYFQLRMAKSPKYSRSVIGGSDEISDISNIGGINETYNRLTLERSVEAYSTLVLDNTIEHFNTLMEAGSEVYHNISDEDHSRSVLVGSDIDHSRSVSGGSNADHNIFVIGGSDEDLSRSVLGGSDIGGANEYDTSLLGASSKDLCRSIMTGSNQYRSRTVLGEYDEELNRSVGCESDENSPLLGVFEEDHNRDKLGVNDKSQRSRSLLEGSDENDIRSILCGSEEDYSRSALGGPYDDHRRSLPGGSDQDDRVQVSDSASSDEQTAYCNPCQRAGNKIAAVKYCEECLHYLCGHCYNIHMLVMAFQQHVLHEVHTKIIRKQTKEAQPSALTTAHLVCSIAVRTTKDKEKQMLWGIAVVRSKFCVVTDWKNKSIKVVDTENMRIISEKRVKKADRLSSITAVNDDHVAVSISIKGVAKVLFYSVSKTGVVKDTHKSFVTSNHFFSMCYSKDRLYATDGCQIYVLSIHGQSIKTIRNNLFDTLFGIALSNDENTIYVGCLCNDTVFNLDMDGNIKASYTDTDLLRPYGISVDSKGFVYVCSYRTGSVHQLTADLKKVQVIIKNDGVEDCDINKTANTLYLSYDTEIKVYNLLPL